VPPVLPVLPLHLGALHPVEQALTFVLAFGPFLVLGVVIWLRRRAEADEPDPADPADPADTGSPGGPAEVEAQRER